MFYSHDSLKTLFDKDEKVRMSFLLPKLASKKEIDQVIKTTQDLVLVLRFGRNTDLTCLQLDEIVSKQPCGYKDPLQYAQRMCLSWV